MKASKIAKIAGSSLLGFVAASLVADRVNLNPLASQITGFVGAFFGTLAARRRAARRKPGEISSTPVPPPPNEPNP